jgi:starch synthase
MRCLYITQEYAPLFAESGLGLTSRALPAELESGHGIVHELVLPYYPWLVEQSGCRTEEVCRLPAVSIGATTADASILRLVHHDGPCEVFLVRSDRWYEREGIYRDATYTEFDDAVERAAFFGFCVAEWVRRTGRRYDVVHGNDWQSGAALAHLRARRADWTPRLLMNVHNGLYVGRLTAPLGTFRLPESTLHELTSPTSAGDANLLQLGLACADGVATCSPAYADQLRSDFEGTPMGRTLARLDIAGIISGVDYRLWNPAATGRPTIPFDHETVDEGKRSNKAALQRRMGLSVGDLPVIGVCSRLVDEKGVDILLDGLTPLLRAGRLQLVLVGPATDRYAAACAALAENHPSGFAHLSRFDQDVAWLVYAGSDFTAMPSRVEPCGLNQLIAMTYGTLPIVSHVGGLRDTVVDLRLDPVRGTGLFIPEPTAEGVRWAALDAIAWLHDRPDQTRAARRRAMAADWSWRRTATEFARLYARLLDGGPAADVHIDDRLRTARIRS